MESFAYLRNVIVTYYKMKKKSHEIKNICRLVINMQLYTDIFIEIINPQYLLDFCLGLLGEL